MCFSVFSFFFVFVFHAKSDTTSNHGELLSDIPIWSPFSRNSTEINKLPKKFEKNRFEIFDFFFWFSSHVFRQKFLSNLPILL